ncbi:MAG: hypothetical protein HONBIEJF_00205 [Fimbriimonadaceae bacterium]|nr:hypothetical protein [Fimbriimonadaceae bacterium]
MNKTFKYSFAAIATVAVISLFVGSKPVYAQVVEALVRLQQTTPGVQQTGHIHVSGTTIAGQFVGNGAGLTGVPAASLTGTILDARLSSNVALLSANQTFTGSKTFGSTVTFSGLVPFTVLPGSGKITNLNADKLDGLSEGAFLKAIPNPLVLQGEVANGAVIAGINSSTTSGSSGVYGESSSPTGIGVYGQGGHADSWAGYFTGGQGLYASQINIGNTLQTNVPLQFGQGQGEKINFRAGTAHGIGIIDSNLVLHYEGGTAMLFGFDSDEWFQEKVRLDDQGRVGIGTATPTSLLDVNGMLTCTEFKMTGGASGSQVLCGTSDGTAFWGQVDNTRLTSDRDSFAKVTDGTWTINSNGDLLGASNNKLALYIGSTLKVRLDPNGLDGGSIRTYGSNGEYNTVMTSLAGNPNHGYMAVYDYDGVSVARMYVDSAGRGKIEADVKNFVVPDPEDPSKDIVYACLEGPEAAMYMRGTARLMRGSARIQLPDHFRKLASPDGMTVLLTPHGRNSRGLSYESADPTGFTVFELEQGTGSYDFDWEIKAVRKGYEDYKVVRPWDEGREAGNRDEQWSARLRSIANQKRRTQNNGGRP